MGLYEREPWSQIAVEDIGEHHGDWHVENRNFHGWLPNDEFRFDEFHEDMASLCFQALEALCTNVRANGSSPDRLGWIDYVALSSTLEIDGLAGFMVPLERAEIEDRRRFIEHHKVLRGALPWSEGEREWLGEMVIDPPTRIAWQTASDREMAVLGAVAAQAGDAVSEGTLKTVVGSELLERFRQWRREEGDYADGVGLERARTALASIITLLRPSIGLPAEYEETRPSLTAIPKP